MKLRFNLLFIIYGFWLISAITPIFSLSIIAKETFKINLDQELKKGNFLIGLKQYLGAKSDSFAEKKNITFTTKDNFLKLHSLNGFKHKSKKMNIVFITESFHDFINFLHLGQPSSPEESTEAERIVQSHVKEVLKLSDIRPYSFRYKKCYGGIEFTPLCFCLL